MRIQAGYNPNQAMQFHPLYCLDCMPVSSALRQKLRQLHHDSVNGTLVESTKQLTP